MAEPNDISLQSPEVSPEKRLTNALKAAAYAVRLYPAVQWVPIEPSVFIAQSRLPKNSNQRDILEKELIQARILVGFGSTVYLLPEEGREKHPDAVVDGHIMEFKTVTGKVDRVEEHYRKSRKKSSRIFFKIDSDLSQEAVLRKLIDRIRKGIYSGGLIIAYFTHTGKTYFWEEDRLK
jgi:hypothetical protein